MSSTTASKPTGGLLGGLVRRATGTPQDRAKKAKAEARVPTIAEVLAGPGGANAATVEPLAGKVVATGADVEAAEKGRKPASRWMPVRIVVGCWTAPKALRAYTLVTELDDPIARAKAAGDLAREAWSTNFQQAISDKRQAKIAKLVREVIPVWVPSLFGGWLVATAALIGLAGLWFWLKKAGGSAHGVIVERLAEAAVISLAWTILTCWWAGGVSAGYGWRNGIVTALAMLAVLGPLVGWAVWATKDDGTIEDNLRANEAMVADTTPEQGRDSAVVKAITSSSAALAKDAVIRVVAPGVVQLAEGRVWQVTVDTGGPTAQPIIDAIDDIASRMNLDAASCFPERVPGLGRQVRITAVVKDPLAEQIPSPLVDMDQVDIFDGVPWGTTIVGDRITLPMVFHNYLIGGLPDMGKSTSGAPILDAYVLSSLKSKLWIADGGRVDTAPIHRLGLAHRWVTNDPAAVLEMLTELSAYADERQEMLDEFGATRPGFGKKVTPEFCEHYGVGPDLLWWDEFASHMSCADKDIKRELRATANGVLQRIRKLAITAVLSTQSPSSIAIDTDGRDVISDRFALPCSTWQMSDKILGPGEAKAGHNAQRLPRHPGRGYLSTSRGGVVIAQSDWISDEQHEAIYRRGVALRRGTQVASAADDDRLLLGKVVGLIKERGATVRSQRVMLLRDVAAAVGMDPMELRNHLSTTWGIGTQKIRRTDDSTADNRAHYVLDDFPSQLAALR